MSGQPDVDSLSAPTVNTSLAGGYCQRAPAQGACTYANICETCPSFHTTSEYTQTLTVQRDRAVALAEQTSTRGWDSETERHLRLIARLNALIDTTTTRPTAM